MNETHKQVYTKTACRAISPADVRMLPIFGGQWSTGLIYHTLEARDTLRGLLIRPSMLASIAGGDEGVMNEARTPFSTSSKSVVWDQMGVRA